MIPSFETSAEIARNCQPALAAYFSDFIGNRRIISRHHESISFLSTTYLEREVTATLDQSFFEEFLEKWPDYQVGDEVPIVLGLFANGLDLDFTVEIDGAPGSLLTSNQASLIALSMVSSAYWADTQSSPPIDFLIAAYECITRCGIDDQNLTFDIGKYAPAATRDMAITNATLGALHGRYLAVTYVPVNARSCYYRRVETLPPEGPAVNKMHGWGLKTVAKRSWDGIGRAVGIQPLTLQSPILTCGKSQRSHVVISAPEAMLFSEMTVGVDSNSQRASAASGDEPTYDARVAGEDEGEDHGPGSSPVPERMLARMSTTRSAFYTRGDVKDPLWVEVELRPCPSLGLYSALVASAVILAVSLLGVFGNVLTYERVDVSATATVLLLVPSAMVGFAFVAGEDELQADALARPRTILATALGAYFAASLLLAMKVDGCAVDLAWWSSAVTSATSTACFWCLIRAGRKFLYERRNRGHITQVI
ncbi:hypothetical protein [Barrientosiimonas humi]|nr:hypothetical protein [Barrientosiimonas humi]